MEDRASAQSRLPLSVSQGKNWFWKGCKPNSVCALRRRESFVLATDTRSPSRFHGTRSEPLRGFLFGLAPDGVCRAALLALRAVRFYRTFSPLPLRTGSGGLFSVALSVGITLRFFRPRVSRPKNRVTRHRALWCSDFPPPTCAGSDPPPFQNHEQPTRRNGFNKRRALVAERHQAYRN